MLQNFSPGSCTQAPGKVPDLQWPPRQQDLLVHSGSQQVLELRADTASSPFKIFTRNTPYREDTLKDQGLTEELKNQGNISSMLLITCKPTTLYYYCPHYFKIHFHCFSKHFNILNKTGYSTQNKNFHIHIVFVLPSSPHYVHLLLSNPAVQLESFYFLQSHSLCLPRASSTGQSTDSLMTSSSSYDKK